MIEEIGNMSILGDLPGLPAGERPDRIVDVHVPGLILWAWRLDDEEHQELQDALAWVPTHIGSGFALTYIPGKGRPAGLRDLELAKRAVKGLGFVADGRGRINWRADVERLRRTRAAMFAVYFLNGLVPITEVPKGSLVKLEGLGIRERVQLLEDGTWAKLYGIRSRRPAA